jgi:POT family proton-dependent oligopeptide transporter
LIVFTGSIIVLLVGRQRYIRNPPTGSLILRAFRVIKTAIQMRWKLGKQDDKKHLLDYAKELESPNDKEENKQNILLNQFIDDLKQVIRACRVFAFYPFYWICYNQLVGNLTSQAAQMNVGKIIHQTDSI